MKAIAHSCLAHYEELRGRVLAGRALGSRLGLSLLVGGGMAAWLREWVSCWRVQPSTVQSTPTATQVQTLTDECCVDVVSVLADMALSNLVEATA